jgi:hypothetical protein
LFPFRDGKRYPSLQFISASFDLCIDDNNNSSNNNNSNDNNNNDNNNNDDVTFDPNVKKVAKAGSFSLVLRFSISLV